MVKIPLSKKKRYKYIKIYIKKKEGNDIEFQ